MFAYVEAAEIAAEKKGPLFRTLNRHRELTQTRIHPNDVLRMIKRYAWRAGLSDKICCHTFRATGITEYLRAGGTIEKAAAIANGCSCCSYNLREFQAFPTSRFEGKLKNPVFLRVL